MPPPSLVAFFAIALTLNGAAMLAWARWAGTRGAWGRLARAYPAADARGGRFVASVLIGSWRYKGSLRLRFDDDGLQLVHPLGRLVAHAPIRIPWSALTIQPCDGPLGRDGSVLVAQGAPDAPIRLGGRAEWLVRQRLDGVAVPAE